MTVAIKRVYAPASPDDGTRVLVDRLWPRGWTKERAAIEEWLRDLAPSHARAAGTTPGPNAGTTSAENI